MKSSQNGGNPCPKRRNQLRFKQWMCLEPTDIAGRRMRHGDETRKIRPPFRDDLRKWLAPLFRKMPADRILAEQDRHPDIRHASEQLRSPDRRAFGPGRQITALPRAGIAKAHRDQGDPIRIIEGHAIDTEPIAQAVAARIIERAAFLMRDPPRRLPDDQEPRLRPGLKDRARPQREMRRTKPASPDISAETFHRTSFFSGQTP